MHPYIDHTIQTNGIHLHYIEFSNPGKPKMILLHGLTANAHAFSGLIAAGLAEHFHLVCPDLRGRGKSDSPDYKYSFKDHALDIIGMMDHLGWNQVILGGHSFGGLLSAYMAANYPNRVQKVIILDAAAELNPLTAEMLTPTLARLNQVYANPEAYLNEVKQAEQNTFWANEMETYYRADLQIFDDGTCQSIPQLKIMYRVMTFVVNTPWKQIFSKINQPVLLINGVGIYTMNEVLLPEEKAKETLDILKDATYLKLEGNHHTMLYGDDAKRITDAILTFSEKEPRPIQKADVKGLKVAVVGATGLVGSTILKILEERNFPIETLVPVASSKSAGKAIVFKGKEYTVVTAEEAIAANCDLALFSAGGSTSLKYAPLFAAKGTTVIDNSSAWRMDADKKLIVPEVNASVLTSEDKIIANPNCSTIQLVAILKPLHDRFKIKRVVVSTYQSVSGSGLKGLQQLKDNQQGNTETPKFYPFPIHENILPHIDDFAADGYTKEELKMIHETKKILGDDSVLVTATTVRVPVRMGHSESVNIEFEKEINMPEIFQIFLQDPNIVLMDNPALGLYPLPIEVEGQDEIFVGRIREDKTQANTINCWIVADNIRKGAATNTVQIAEALLEKNLI